MEQTVKMTKRPEFIETRSFSTGSKNVKYLTIRGNWLLKKLQIKLLQDPFLGIYPKELKPGSWRESISMFTVPFSTIPKMWNKINVCQKGKKI